MTATMKNLGIYLTYVAGTIGVLLLLTGAPSVARYVALAVVVAAIVLYVAAAWVSLTERNRFQRWFDANWGWRFRGEPRPLPVPQDKGERWVYLIVGFIFLLAIGKFIYDLMG